VIFPEAGGLPRHPSQLYESFGEGLILGLTMFWMRSRKLEPSGQVTGCFFMVYAAIRFVLEYFREPDAGDPLILGMSRGQMFSIALAVAGFAVWRIRSTRRLNRGS
jgi:phosphatidylglycerol:prolipoprotein diacylglycerol transferase